MRIVITGGKRMLGRTFQQVLKQHELFIVFLPIGVSLILLALRKGLNWLNIADSCMDCYKDETSNY